MKQFQTVKSPTYPNSHRTPCQLPTHPTVSELPYTDASFTVRWDLRSPFTILPAWQIFRFSTFHMGPSQLHSRHVSPLKILQKTIYSVQNGGFFAITQLWRSCTLVVNLTLVGNFGGFSMKVTDIYIYILRITLADVQHGLTHDQLIPEQNKTWICWYAFVHIDIAALSVSLFLLWWKIFAPWYTVVHIVELTVHLKV